MAAFKLGNALNKVESPGNHIQVSNSKAVAFKAL